ncbi:MAG: DUF4340 domain-containing protein [Oscillospiraceae bacterium]
MNKKIKAILIGGVVLLLLVGIILVLSFSTKSKEENVSATSSLMVPIWNFERTDILSISVENENGGYMAEMMDDQNFGIRELEEYPQNSHEYVTLTTRTAALNATSLVEENPSDLEKYGLDNPRVTAVISLKDGSKKSIFLGKDLPTHGGYYCRVNDDSKVYAVAGVDVDRLFFNKFQFLNLEIVPTISDENATPNIPVLKIEGATFGDNPLILEKGETGNYGESYNIVSPIHAALNSSTGAPLIQGLYGITATSVVDIAKTTEKKAAYGFDKPYSVIHFTRDKTNFVLRIGGETTAEDGTAARYLMKSDSDLVYVIPVSSLPWITADINNLFSSLFLVPSINTVDTVTVEAGKNSYMFQTTGEDENLAVTLNGNKISAENYRLMYEFLLSASIKEINQGSTPGEMLAKITYHYRDGKKSDDTLAFFAVSERKCVISLNGDNSFLAETRYVDKLLSNCEKISKGETPSLEL